ncbi:NAD/NADP octopine/nopaline dehydrogenase family protein [Rhodococcus sp. A14]|uniref:NAD/NADP octopine/nopaline dehydrogenase family protein n=1 Tax=Rhodococcus sp. A14 TaxID=1194106 RepID=UPI0014247678|nr:hypothetical protein [Rhodococcus sp. A14]
MAAVTAAWASATAGTEVVYATDETPPGTWSAQVTWHGHSQPAQLARVQVGTPFEADAFMLIAPRDESIALTRLYAESMQGKPVLVAPGGFAIVEAIDEVLNTGTSIASPVGQLPGFPITGDVEPGNVRIRAVKRNFPLGQLRHKDSSDLVETFRIWFPDLAASTLAETTLGNMNNILHPPILLVNAARSEAGEDYLFYRQGASSGASQIISGIDDERLDVMRALNQKLVPFTELFKRYYGDQGLVGETIDQMIASVPTLAGARGPKTLEHRYVSEDVIYGLAPMEELAHRLDVATPCLSSLITILSTVCGSNLREAAPSLVDQSALYSTAVV